MKRATISGTSATETQLLLFGSLRKPTVESDESMSSKRALNREMLEAAGWKPPAEQPVPCMAEGCYQSIQRWRRRKKGQRTEFRYLTTATLVDHDCQLAERLRSNSHE
jgi:hypothetical protein